MPIVMTTKRKRLKNKFTKLDTRKVSLAYINRFESAVKVFEKVLEEENVKRGLLIKSRFASFN